MGLDRSDPLMAKFLEASPRLAAMSDEEIVAAIANVRGEPTPEAMAADAMVPEGVAVGAASGIVAFAEGFAAGVRAERTRPKRYISTEEMVYELAGKDDAPAGARFALGVHMIYARQPMAEFCVDSGWFMFGVTDGIMSSAEGAQLRKLGWVPRCCQWAFYLPLPEALE